MTSYSPKGVHLDDVTLPWDLTEPATLEGQAVTRRALIVPTGVAFAAPGLGWVRPRDAGRLFIVDELPDGTFVEHLRTP